MNLLAIAALAPLLVTAPGDLSVTGNPGTIELKEGKKRVDYLRIDDAGDVVFEVEGPAVLSVTIRELRNKKRGKPASGTITLLRNGSHVSESPLAMDKAKGKKIRSAGFHISGKLIRHR